jgi:hypothetical protein
VPETRELILLATRMGIPPDDAIHRALTVDPQDWSTA